jgi:hypothetical protein
MGKRKQRSQGGIFKKKRNANDPDVKVLDFSYTGDALVNVVVAAWSAAPGGAFYTDLMSKDATRVRACLATHGVFLSNPVVLTEDDYEDGWEQDNDDQVVLVLPNKSRAGTPSPGGNLLETAKALMACTPHGI